MTLGLTCTLYFLLPFPLLSDNDRVSTPLSTDSPLFNRVNWLMNTNPVRLPSPQHVSSLLSPVMNIIWVCISSLLAFSPVFSDQNTGNIRGERSIFVTYIINSRISYLKWLFAASSFSRSQSEHSWRNPGELPKQPKPASVCFQCLWCPEALSVPWTQHRLEGSGEGSSQQRSGNMQVRPQKCFPMTTQHNLK